MGIREQLHLLNLKGHAPKLDAVVNGSTPSGYVLEWNAANLGFTPTKPSILTPFILASDLLVSSNDYTVVAAQFTLNGSDFSSSLTWTFNMIAAIVQHAGTAEARLYNLSDQEYVTNATITTTNSAPTSVQSPTLVVGSASGNIKDTEKIYEVRLRTVIGDQTAALSHFGTISFRIS